jgi:rhodanese-related sulfurtransferase
MNKGLVLVILTICCLCYCDTVNANYMACKALKAAGLTRTGVRKGSLAAGVQSYVST